MNVINRRDIFFERMNKKLYETSYDETYFIPILFVLC